MSSGNPECLSPHAKVGGKQVISKCIIHFILFILLISTKYAAVLNCFLCKSSWLRLLRARRGLASSPVSGMDAETPLFPNNGTARCPAAAARCELCSADTRHAPILLDGTGRASLNQLVIEPFPDGGICSLIFRPGRRKSGIIVTASGMNYKGFCLKNESLEVNQPFASLED